MDEVRTSGASPAAAMVAGEGTNGGPAEVAGAAPVAIIGASGPPELAVARALAELEKQRDRLQESRHEAKRLERAAEERQIKDMRRASRFGLAAGLVQAGGEAASGAAGLAGTTGSASSSDATGASATSQSNAWGQLAQAAGTLTDACLRHGQTNADIDAEEARHDAKAHGDVADALDDERRRADRIANKMGDHLARIADARMQARLEAARG